ncbi:hypothetical protein CAPTEDRAFT_182518, partial [Capitella teleta]
MKSEGAWVCLVFYLICPANIIGLWWAVGSPLVMDPNIICRKSRKLGGKQHEMCRNEPEIVEEVANGAKMAISECQHQFRHRRWNCTTANRSIQRVLKHDTREAAFVHSLTSAGVLYAVTQACSLGLLLQCMCDNSVMDRSTDGKWEWAGCNEDVRFGSRKAAEFLDIPPTQRNDVQGRILLHNNKAGRASVAKYQQKICKCHGLSGSCELKTCVLKMPSFRDVGDRLKERFDGAYKVSIANDGRNIIPIEDHDAARRPSGENLVYLDESPSFCKPSRKQGSLGTLDRLCNPDTSTTDSCDIMCCGRGYRSYKVVVQENCRCQFKWCCKVICQTCSRTLSIHRCN